MRKLPLFVMGTALAALVLVGRGYGLADTKKTDADAKKEKHIEALLIAAQAICPVSGHKLGSMGETIKAKSGERTIYLCCEGCMGQPIKAEAWKQIQKNLAAAQKICPIMKKPLPEDPKSTVVEGRTVFVCCEPCIEKVKADPAKALAVVNAQLEKNVKLEKKTKK